MRIKIKEILFILLPINFIYDLICRIRPLFCRHQMKYFQMKWVVNTDDHSDPNYKRFNGKVWKDAFCECGKCSIQKRMIMKVGEFGKWENEKIAPSKNGIIEIEIVPFGGETKSQRRERLIGEILK